MRLIISGWHGQLARALTDAALGASDIKALAVGRPALDVRDPRSIERVFADVTPDLVINTAAYTAVDQAESEPDRAFALNRDGAELFARAAARRNVPIIHLSTHYVFDGTKPAPYVETDATAPQTVYGRTKLAGEEAVRAANPRHVVLRSGWLYSAAGRNFFTTVRDLAAKGDGPMRMVADQRGNPTYAPDLAMLILDLARRVVREGEGANVWGTYHAASQGETSWHDAAKAILSCLEKSGLAVPPLESIESASYPSKAPRPANSTLDSTKLESTFGLALPPWEQGIAACTERALAG